MNYNVTASHYLDALTRASRAEDKTVNKTDATETFKAVDGLNAALAAVTKPATVSTQTSAKTGTPRVKAAKTVDVDLEAAAKAAPVQTARAKRDAATGPKPEDAAILALLATGKPKAAVAKELNVKAYAVNAAVERHTYGRLRRSSDLAAAAQAKADAAKG